jgi:phosphatidylserine decarboxylase
MKTLFVLFQRILPKHLLTALVYRLARIRIAALKNWFITRFIAAYKVDVDEIDTAIPDGFASFNDFFTRELAPGSRPVELAADILVSPVDGTVSAAGKIDRQSVFQAKGISYSLADLLASDLEIADRFVDGSFATIYLAPYNYHRVHCPLAGELQSAHYVPGDLYSVNEATVAKLPGLFVRNERLVCRFRSSIGPMILIFVGAMKVGSISTPWTGEIRPRQRGDVQLQDLAQSGASRKLQKGDLLGWFNMGSTVILLTPGNHCRWLENMTQGMQLKMGEAIGHLADLSA